MEDKGSNHAQKKGSRRGDRRRHRVHSRDHATLTIDFDDLAPQFSETIDNRMLDILVPDPNPPAKDSVVDAWAGRQNVGLSPLSRIARSAFTSA
jgi:hypothetical protein